MKNELDKDGKDSEESETLSILHKSLLSVHGIIRIKYIPSNSTVDYSGVLDCTINLSIEACAGVILVRESEGNDDGQNTNSQNLTVQGAFVKPTEILLSKLFNSCEKLNLQSKCYLNHGDVTVKMREAAQLKYCGVNHKLRALPGGWWFDGNVYLDVDGNRRQFRPDIDDILDDYLIEKNKEIEDYNNHLNHIQIYL
jgi:hypothetical protein